MLLALLLACETKNPCEAYVEAYTKCLNDAGAVVNIDAETQCADYESEVNVDAYYACMADAYDRDCAADGATQTASEAAAECQP